MRKVSELLSYMHAMYFVLKKFIAFLAVFSAYLVGMLCMYSSYSNDSRACNNCVHIRRR